MQLRILHSLRSGFSVRLSASRLNQMLAPKELEELGFGPRDLTALAGRPRGLCAAELYGPYSRPQRRAERPAALRPAAGRPRNAAPLGADMPA